MSAEKMIQAYRMLFEIEYNLRKEIQKRMYNCYGVMWEKVGPRFYIY
jgi:hypothetical protein